MTTDSDDRLMADAARLARAIPPERDLWPAIEAAIVPGPARAAEPARRSRTRYLAQAAAVVVLAGGSSLITYLVMDSGPGVLDRPAGQLAERMSEPATEPATGQLTVQSAERAGSQKLVLEEASFGGQYELSSAYKLARTDLETRMAQELEKLSPGARANVEQNLAVIRGAIAEINAALAQEPGNALLQDLLLRTYREELSVMRKVGGLTQDVMLRNDI